MPMFDKRTKAGKEIAGAVGFVKLVFWIVVIGAPLWGLYSAIYWVGEYFGLIDPGSLPRPY